MAVNVGTLDPTLTNDINAIITDRRDIDFSSTIAELEPNAAPLMVILSKIGKRPVDEVEFRWFEQDPLNRWLTVTSGGPDADDTSFVVPDVSGIYVGDIIRCTMYVSGALREEVMLVTAINTATRTLTVTRGYGEASPQDFSGASATSPMEVLVIGNVSQEGSGAPSDRNKQPSVIRNVTGITKTPFAVTGSLDASKQRANPQERARLQRYWGVEHKKQIELMALFGVLTEDLSAGAPKRVTRGVVGHITTNVFDLGGLADYHIFVSAAEEIFKYGDNPERWLFCGPKFLTALAKLGPDRLRLEPAETEFGVKFNRIVTPHGDFRVVKHPLFRGPVWSKGALALDLSSEGGEALIQYRPLRGRDTKLQLNIQANDEDAVRDQYLTEFGIQVKLEKRHGIFVNAG